MFLFFIENVFFLFVYFIFILSLRKIPVLLAKLRTSRVSNYSEYAIFFAFGSSILSPGIVQRVAEHPVLKEYLASRPATSW